MRLLRRLFLVLEDLSERVVLSEDALVLWLDLEALEDLEGSEALEAREVVPSEVVPVLVAQDLHRLLATPTISDVLTVLSEVVRWTEIG